MGHSRALHPHRGFLAPGLYRPRQNLGALAVDAALGMIIGAALGAVIARFTGTRRWVLWMLFVAAFLISRSLCRFRSHPRAPGALARLPMIPFALCGASLGFWLGPRGGEPSAAH